jgi:hypothetical protein
LAEIAVRRRGAPARSITRRAPIELLETSSQFSQERTEFVRSRYVVVTRPKTQAGRWKVGICTFCDN